MQEDIARLNARFVGQLTALSAMTDINAAGYKSMDEAVRKLLHAREKAIQALEKASGL